MDKVVEAAAAHGWHYNSFDRIINYVEKWLLGKPKIRWGYQVRAVIQKRIEKDEGRFCHQNNPL